MTGLTNIIYRLCSFMAAAVTAAGLLSSCGSDAPVIPADTSAQEGTISFRVYAPKVSGAGGRATWSDEYTSERGDDFETGLLNYQLSVIITDADCSEQYAVTNLYCAKTTELAFAVAYDYTGRILKDDLDKVRRLSDGKLHVIANAGYHPTLSSDTSFKLFGVPGSNFRGIPMWGVKTADFSSVGPGLTISTGDVSLLRAMAKVVINMDDSSDNYIKELRTVTVSTANQIGYLLPDRWASVSNTGTLDRHAVRIPEQVQTGPVTFDFSAKNDVEFYLPELCNQVGDDEIRLTLTYLTKMGDVWTSDLYFRQYTGGDPIGLPYDIRRNYLYRYTVSMPSENEISVIADLKPYESVELKPEFGI